MTTVIWVSGATQTVPSDWNSSSNTVEAIGGGGNGANGTANINAAGAGGGGEYRKAANVALTASATLTSGTDYQIAAGGSGNTTFLKDNGSTLVLSAVAGVNASAATHGAGGTGGTGAAANFDGGAGGDGASGS